jgi:hypothetical protein
MNYHSNITANSAAVNQENLFRQVAVILPRVIFELRQLVPSVGVILLRQGYGGQAATSCSLWSEN